MKRMFMKPGFTIKGAAGLAIAIWIGIGPIHKAEAQVQKPATYELIYVEVSPTSICKAVVLLKQHAQAALRSPGNLGFLVLQRHPDTNQFVLVAQWNGNASLKAYQQALDTKQFRAKLSPLMIAPYDERANIDYQGNPARAQAAMAAAPANTVFVLVHVDIAPEAKQQGARAISALTQQSQTVEGNYVFNVLNQSSHSNHFSFFEAWANPADFTEYKDQAFVRRFRETLMPIMGSIYEERIYSDVN
jgi:quinol monooxygenase YgiN